MQRKQKGSAAPAAVAQRAKVVNEDDTPKALPLHKRSIDIVWAVWYAIFLFSVLFTDLHNFIASYRGITVVELEQQLESEQGRVWPPKPLSYIYYRWARTLDPLLYQNPIWWQCIEWVNLCVLMPFSALAIGAFLKGSGWVRIPGVVVSSFTAYSLVLCIGSTLFGESRTSDPAMFVAIYGPYFTMPLLAILRLWNDAPFATPLSATRSFVLWVGTTATLAVFLSYVLKWFVLCEPTWLPAQALPHLQQLLELPGGSVCPTA